MEDLPKLPILRKDIIRETEWYEQFDNDVSDAIDDLKDNLGVSPSRDLAWIRVSMRVCNAWLVPRPGPMATTSQAQLQGRQHGPGVVGGHDAERRTS